MTRIELLYLTMLCAPWQYGNEGLGTLLGSRSCEEYEKTACPGVKTAYVL